MTNPEWLFCQTAAEAKAVQTEMAERVILTDAFASLRTVAGMDLSNTPFDPEEKVFGAAVVLNASTLEILEISTKANRQSFPYITGLLGFREVPTLVDVYQKLSLKPDLIMVDGHGISHPRGLGVASHLGVLLDVPTIGVAKSILIGSPAGPLGEAAGSTVPLVWKDKEIGKLIRTKKRCSPLIISTGHRVSLETAVRWVLACIKKHRLPEPTRQAHLAANACRLLGC